MIDVRRHGCVTANTYAHILTARVVCVREFVNEKQEGSVYVYVNF